MPKLQGIRERRHQPYYDTILRIDANGTPSPTVNQRSRLFSGTNLGNKEWTNLPTASQFPSDQTFIILAIRCFMQFVGSNALTMYQLVSTQLYLTLFVGDKPQFGCPAWYFPQGGGIVGCDSVTPSMTNGVASNEAITKLAKPIPVTARQHFYVEAEFHDVGSSSVRTEYLNSTTSIGSREIKVLLDGLHTRDVL